VGNRDRDSGANGGEVEAYAVEADHHAGITGDASVVWVETNLVGKGIERKAWGEREGVRENYRASLSLMP